MIGHIFKELFREKVRIILTILAVAWGTFSIALMLSVGEGLRSSFGASVSKAGHNLMNITPGLTSMNFKGIRAGENIQIYPQTYEQIKNNVGNISAISQQYLPHMNLRHSTNKFLANIAAISPAFAQIHNIKIKAGGRFINQLDINTNAKVIVLGTQAWQRLFPQGRDPVGKMIQLNNTTMQVVGVMTDKPEMVSQQLSDANYSWIPESTYRLLVNSHTVDSIAISYQQTSELPTMKKQITTLLALANGANPNDSSIVSFDDVAAQQHTTSRFLLALEIFLGIVGGLTLVVAGTGIANVMFASVNQNIREIGLRMAIGAKPRHILIHYVLESLMATGIGGIIGILFTIIVVTATNFIPLHGEVFQVFGKPQPKLSLTVLISVIAILGCVGFAAGFFPARTAAAIEPAEALRHD